MREIAEQVRRWASAGDDFAVAVVVGVRGSAPRQPGAAMAVNSAGEVVGSVSGGCVEGAVYDLANEVLRTGEPRLATYGISDDDAFAVGLTCGGILDILVLPGRAEPVRAVAEALVDRRPVAWALVVGGEGVGRHLAVFESDSQDGAGDGSGPAGGVVGSLGVEGLDVAVVDDARGMLAQGTTDTRRYGPRGERLRDEVAVFVQSFRPPPRMLVFGAIDFAAAVVRMGALLGYRVTVCDARPVFATRQRFPEADEVVCEWPARYLARTAVDATTVICVLTHDPKFDVPLLREALRSPAAYVGAMGSRRTHADRLARLREIGMTEEELARLHSPIGLDIGARTPEETAVSIAAEIIQCRWGGTGRPLREVDGRIHAAAERRPAAGRTESAGREHGHTLRTG